MDPRVDVGQEELAALLEFQQRVESLLRDSMAQVGNVSDPSAGHTPSVPETVVRSVVKDLTELAIDLERADAPPTPAQRELFQHEARRLLAPELSE